MCGRDDDPSQHDQSTANDGQVSRLPPEIIDLLGRVPSIEWSTGPYGNVFGGHVGEDHEDYEDGIPCRITTGGFDDQESAELAVAAVNFVRRLASAREETE